MVHNQQENKNPHGGYLFRAPQCINALSIRRWVVAASCYLGLADTTHFRTVSMSALAHTRPSTFCCKVRRGILTVPFQAFDSPILQENMIRSVCKRRVVAVSIGNSKLQVVVLLVAHFSHSCRAIFDTLNESGGYYQVSAVLYVPSCC